jgi:hypothetical protein
MKKIYVSPAIEEFLVKTTVLMEPSLPVNSTDDPVPGTDVLSRGLFDDAVFDED